MVRVPAEVPLAYSHTLACSESLPAASPGYHKVGFRVPTDIAIWVLSDESIHKSNIFSSAFLKGKKNQLPTFSCLQIKQIPVMS